LPVASAPQGTRPVLTVANAWQWGPKLPEKKLVCVPAGSKRLIALVQGRQFRPTNHKNISPTGTNYIC